MLAASEPNASVQAPALPDDDEQAQAVSDLPDGTDRFTFGRSLEPALRRACQGRLSEVSWFRSDWQRGGALTGFAEWTDDDGRVLPAFVKMPVPPCERHWLAALQAHPDVAPRLFGHGEQVEGYDLAWIVMEKIEHGPLGSAWLGKEFDLLAEAAGRFYAAAAQHPLVGQPLQKDWQAIYELSRKHAHNGSLAESQRWNAVLKKAHRKLKDWIAQWEQRPCEDWCHGDLHLANALTRSEPPDGPALLVDFARTRVGHWVEDAIYFEHLFWARRQRLGDRRPASMIAHQRKHHGLKVSEDWPRYADLKRALLAMSTPAMLPHDGEPHHVHAALEVLERAVG